MWQFLKAYYAKVASSTVHKTLVVSSNGGRIIDVEIKHVGFKTVVESDIDRAFAWNIGAPFYTLREYMSKEPIQEKFTWNTMTLSPEQRKEAVEILAQYRNPSIFKSLLSVKVDVYMIVIYGPPRSGKTTLAKEIIRKWRESTFGKTHVIKRFGPDKYSKLKRITAVRKALQDMISVVVEGYVHTAKSREPFQQMAKDYKAGVLYIEVDPGIGMANIFNHAAVETSSDEYTHLLDPKDYRYYISQLNRPANVLKYCPVIQQTKEIMWMRY